MMYDIYLLEYSIDKSVYIGSTKDSKSRFRNHKSKQKDGQIITMTILDTVVPPERYFWERFYLDLFKSFGFSTKNKFIMWNSFVSARISLCDDNRETVMQVKAQIERYHQSSVDEAINKIICEWKKLQK